MNNYFGQRLRMEMKERNIIPFMGVYDVFSASIAARHYNGIFISGYSFSASYYGLPDIGFIAWPDIVSFAQRVRTILPKVHVLVDIDDGYGDIEVACHVVSLLEASGVTGIVIEDQKRPRRCGHFDGKQLLELGDYIEKLKKVLATRKDLFVIARTDATKEKEIINRVKAFDATGADAVLVDAVSSIDFANSLKDQISAPLVFNQIAGGKTPLYSLEQMRDMGVSLAIYSTPCLFAAQSAIEDTMKKLVRNDGLLEYEGQGQVGISESTYLLNKNLKMRDEKKQHDGKNEWP